MIFIYAYICIFILNIHFKRIYGNRFSTVAIGYKTLKSLQKYSCNLRKYLYFWRTVYNYDGYFSKDGSIHMGLETVLALVKP